MIDLYQLLEKQEYAEVELADGTSLVIQYDSGKKKDVTHSAWWRTNSMMGIKMPSDAELLTFCGKTARIAITAALQARYGEN